MNFWTVLFVLLLIIGLVVLIILSMDRVSKAVYNRMFPYRKPVIKAPTVYSFRKNSPL